MKLFVTGGTGFLGRAVIDEALLAGHAVRAMVRDPRSRLPDGAEGVAIAFDAGERLVEAIRGTDAIVHLAGRVSRDPKDASLMHSVHVEGSRMLLDAAERAGVRRFVLSSTSGVIGVSDAAGRPATEGDRAPLEIIGRWPYYVSKRLQEEEVLRRNAQGRIDAVVLNPSLLLGPHDERLSSVGDVLSVLNRRVPAVPSGTMAFVDVRDAAKAFVSAIERGRRGERYLLNSANMSVRNFFERVARAGDVPTPSIRIPDRWAIVGAKAIEGILHALDRISPIDSVAVEMGNRHWACDASKAKREFGFAPRDPQETIHDTVRDLERQGLFRRR